MMEEQYGFATLKQIISFIRKAIGDDATIDIWKEAGLATKEDGSIRKDLNRICKGKYDGFQKSDIIHSDLGQSCSKWFKEYDVTQKLGRAFYPLISGWYRNLVSSEYLMTIPEFSTKHFIFRDTLEFLFNSYKEFPDILNDLMNGKCTYETVFLNIKESLGLKSKTEVYKYFDRKVIEKEQNSVSKDNVRKLEQMVRDDINPPRWEFLNSCLNIFQIRKMLCFKFIS